MGHIFGDTQYSTLDQIKILTKVTCYTVETAEIHYKDVYLCFTCMCMQFECFITVLHVCIAATVVLMQMTNMKFHFCVSIDYRATYIICK